MDGGGVAWGLMYKKKVHALLLASWYVWYVHIHTLPSKIGFMYPHSAPYPY